MQNEYTNVSEVCKALKDLIRCSEEVLNYDENSKMLWRNGDFTKIADTLQYNKHELANKITEIAKLKATRVYIQSKVVQDLINQIDLEKIREEYNELQQYSYNTINVDFQYYKCKTLLYSKGENEGDQPFIQYFIGSFYSKQELNAFLSNFQKGLRNVSIQGERADYQTLRNKYTCLYDRCANENIGDGIHAIVFNNDENIIRVHSSENPIDKFYMWLKNNVKTGIIEEWKTYFYNKLSDLDYLRECEGIDFTGKAPRILVVSKEVDTSLVRTLKQQGLKSGEIVLPVEENTSLDPNMSFLELIQSFVIEYIKNEKAHYNVGEPIDSAISSHIFLDKGIKTKLFPRQQVIAQGLLNAIKDGKKSLFLNGGMGVGKTFTSAKLGAALFKASNKQGFRCVVYAQGTLIPKWHRQFEQCLNPLGIIPKVYEINSFKDVKNIPKQPKGFEIFLMSKDKVKREYMQGYAGVQRWRKPQSNIQRYVSSLDGDEDIILDIAKDFPIGSLKYAAILAEKVHKRPVILAKEQLNDDGKVESYKIVTTSKIIKGIMGKSCKAYDFIIPKDEYCSFKSTILAIKEELIEESELKNRRLLLKTDGCVCPVCNSLQYRKADDLFDEERYIDNIMDSPSDRNEANNKCSGYIKADGTSLTQFEIERIRKKEIEIVITNEKIRHSPYIDDKENILTGEDLIKAKSGKYNGAYKIIVRECKEDMWSALDKTGYRVVNAVDMILKRFGKNSFDFLVGDEVHIYSRESNQGDTFGKLCRLCDVKIGLTGTLTGGKASDLYYMFWRMFPSKMVSMGYKYSDVAGFIDHYGRRKKVTKEYKSDAKYNKTGKGKKVSGGWTEIPGISPLLYTNFLSGTMISRNLFDMNIPMPKLRYFKHEIEMSPELSNGYDSFKNQLLKFMKEHEGLNIGGSYIHGLISYLDYPVQEPIYWKGTDLLVANPPQLDISDKLLPKEEKLLETIRRELKEGRKVLLYSVYSGTKGVSNRLMYILNKVGIRCAELKSTLKVEKREAWIDEQDKKGIDVIVTNPMTVQTGLDIVQYPTVYFYELPYDSKLVRQAEVRPWRPNARHECRVYYSYYKDTLQQDCVKLVGSKKKASLALEGVFSEDMLSAMGDVGDDGAGVLCKILQGKIELKENELDSIGFETEEPSEVIEIPEEQQTVVSVKSKQPTSCSNNTQQLTLFTVTDEDMIRLSKKAKSKSKVIDGQLALFAL